MSEYKVFEIPGRGLRYMKDNKLISKDKISEEELEKLHATLPEPEPEQEPLVIPEKSCLFCQEHTNLTRFVNLQTVYLCEKDYYNPDVTIGKIAQKLRELSDAKSG